MNPLSRESFAALAAALIVGAPAPGPARRAASVATAGKSGRERAERRRRNAHRAANPQRKH